MIFSDRERQAPTSINEAEPTHLARYQLAAKFIKQGQYVLDVPCGSGYGSKLLSTTAATITGVDIYAPAIEHAQEFFHDQNTNFLVSDMENMKNILPDNSLFDTIISFEGIEHIHHPENFLEETKRLLKTNGLLIISTPRKPHGSPYHIKEYTLGEFKDMLEKKFTIRQMYGQVYTDFFDLEKKNLDPYAYPKFNFIAICENNK